MRKHPHLAHQRADHAHGFRRSAVRQLTAREAAQRLLVSTVPAHLAYAWRDGTPLNTPIAKRSRRLISCPKSASSATACPFAENDHMWGSRAHTSAGRR